MNKICKLCNLPKSIDEFHKDKKMLYGVGSRCKSCRKIKNIGAWSKHSPEYKIYHRAKSRAKRKKL